MLPQRSVFHKRSPANHARSFHPAQRLQHFQMLVNVPRARHSLAANVARHKLDVCLTNLLLGLGERTRVDSRIAIEAVLRYNMLPQRFLVMVLPAADRARQRLFLARLPICTILLELVHLPRVRLQPASLARPTLGAAAFAPSQRLQTTAVQTRKIKQDLLARFSRGTTSLQVSAPTTNTT